MNLAITVYPVLYRLRPLPFSLSDALLVLFMHDIEKPWKYIEKDGKKETRLGMLTKKSSQDFRLMIADTWDIKLSEAHVNGIKYAEGELDDYTPHQRTMFPLAAFAHMCDVWSARGWHSHPLIENDPWLGATRIKKT